jgi:hypothetical protein
MPEPTSQAAPQEPVTPASAEVPEFAPETPGSTQPEPQTDTKPITPELIRQLAREEATRIAQSQVAKGENRIQKLIQDKFSALDKTKETLGLTADQVAQAKQKIVAEAYSPEEEEPPTPQPTTPSPNADADQAIQFMNAQIKIAFDRVGTAVTKADPEFAELQKTINEAWLDPNGLTTIVLAAQSLANAKANRLRTNQQTAAGRVIGGGTPSSGQVQSTGSALDMYSEAYKKQ